jgi:hypothetical protein
MMLFAKFKSVLAALLVLGVATLGAGALLSRGEATQPPDERRDRVADLKQELQQLQKKIADLEQETPPRPDARGSRDGFLASRFKYKIPFETGVTESKEGGRIDIQEVWGTRPRIEVGGQYLVRGKYMLPPGERGKLYFYETATAGQGLIPDLDLQSATLDKEKGEFTLLHGMATPGHFHLYLASPERYSRMFANVYFGTGDNVLRKKTW